MFKNKKISLVKDLDSELTSLKNIQKPQRGWINTVRRIINMSLRQVGKKLNMTDQAIYNMEQREQEGVITLDKLKKVAQVFDMQLVYAFVPNKSLEAMIDERALALAKKLVQRTNQTMTLEEQSVAREKLGAQIEEIKTELKNRLDTILWD